MDPIFADILVRQRHAELLEIGKRDGARYQLSWLKLDRPVERMERPRGAGRVWARAIARLFDTREAVQW